MEHLYDLFYNNSDCYADTGRFENDGSYTDGEVISAMTYETFCKVVTQLLSNLSSNEISLLEKVTRLEVIEVKGEGRSYVNWDKRNLISLSFQDELKTLKIIISKKDDNTNNTL